jgi:DNA-binding PadR family transcriptional regulator
MMADSELLILASLAESPKHGYAIMQDIKAMAGVKIGPGTLYGAVPRLEEQGLIEAVDSADRRRPYRLTEQGVRVLRERLQWLRDVSLDGLRRLEAT